MWGYVCSSKFYPVDLFLCVVFRISLQTGSTDQFWFSISGQIIAISITATAASIGAAGIPQVKDKTAKKIN